MGAEEGDEGGRNDGDAVLAAFAVADGELAAGQVEVLDAKGADFAETEAGAVHEAGLEAVGAAEAGEDGADFLAGKYNVAYFAWELPEFPDAWVPALDYYDEIWCPSDFTAAAIAMKSPVPVLTMPHAISFIRPTESVAAIRARLGLPADKFLFLSLFDLNSYAERKNPHGVLAAFRQSGLAGSNAALTPASSATGFAPAASPRTSRVIVEAGGPVS